MLGLGNELLGDDAVGLIAARAVSAKAGSLADVEECGLYGLALLDVLAGREHAVILDAVRTRLHPAGTVIHIAPESLRNVTNLSPHYTGLPEVMRLAAELRLTLPEELEIIGVEAADMSTLGVSLSPEVADAVDGVVDEVLAILHRWASCDRTGT